MTAGAGTAGNSAGGVLTLAAGAGQGTAAGGNASLSAGVAGGTNANGGNLTLAAGSKSGVGTDGIITMQTSGAGGVNVLPPSDLVGNLGVSGTRWGDIAFGGMLANVVTKVADYTITALDWTVLADAAGGAFNVTLPSVAANRGRVFIVKRINAGANKPTIITTGGDTIDGAATLVLTPQYASAMVQAPDAGTDWMVL
jgi:hypothetical protein